MKTVARVIYNHPYSFHYLIAGVVLSIAFYMYCVQGAVKNTVMRTTMLRQASLLQTEVGELEARYMSLSNGMTLESAASLGLLEPQHKMFVR